MSAGDIANVIIAIATLCAAVAGLVKAFRNGKATENVHQEVRPPSNGTTNGAITEGVGAVTTWLTHEWVTFLKNQGKEPNTPPPPSPLANASAIPDRPAGTPLETVTPPTNPPGTV